MHHDSAEINSDYPAVPDDRWWIVEFALAHCGKLAGKAIAKYPAMTESIAFDLVDRVAPKVALPHSPSWRRGFPESDYLSREAGLMDWLFVAVCHEWKNENRRLAKTADLNCGAYDDVASVDAIAAHTDLIAATQEYAQLSEGGRKLAAFRASGASRAAMAARGFSVRQMNKYRVELREASRRLAQFGPIPAILSFFKRGGGEATGAAGGGAAAAGGAAVVGGAGAKVLAGCVAGVICAGVVGGAVVAERGDREQSAKSSQSNTPTQASAPTPSTGGASSVKQRSTDSQKRRRKRRAFKESESSSSSSSSPSTQEFGVERGASAPAPAPSTPAPKTPSATEQEFGFEQ